MISGLNPNWLQILFYLSVICYFRLQCQSFVILFRHLSSKSLFISGAHSARTLLHLLAWFSFCDFSTNNFLANFLTAKHVFIQIPNFMLHFSFAESVIATTLISTFDHQLTIFFLLWCHNLTSKFFSVCDRALMLARWTRNCVVWSAAPFLWAFISHFSKFALFFCLSVPHPSAVFLSWSFWGWECDAIVHQSCQASFTVARAFVV